MKGHQHLIDMRLRGKAPRAVFFDADGGWPVWWWRDWPIDNPSHAHVQLEAGDVAKRLDLRFVVGLPVYVSGAGENAKLARDAVIAAGAKRVICVTDDSITDYDHADHS